ncbi:hypothetical protein F4781DRAFT_430895 [Annulohypoxylon bovei var. microspora]|nr:hypothetical protein F4781DRAFT_430895 [Annulohypoxylon bovei var. microspora]
MRFTYFLSAFLATLTIASPISSGADVTESISLVTRDTEKQTDEYKAALKAHAGLQKDQYYYFFQKDNLGAKILDSDAETLTELEQLQKNLGFEHIGVIVGQVTEVTVGKTGKKTTTKDFKATYYHMTKDKKNNVMGHGPNWKASLVDFSKSTLVYGGQTNKKGVDNAKKNSKDYLAEADHKTYDIGKNNCNTYAQAVAQAFK